MTEDSKNKIIRNEKNSFMMKQTSRHLVLPGTFDLVTPREGGHRSIGLASEACKLSGVETILF